METIAVMLPDNVENLSLPSPELTTFYRNQQNRTFWLDFDIDANVLEISRNILLINKEDAAAGIEPEDRKPITLMIFTDGGELDPTFSLIDTIALSKTPVVTVNAGRAMSAGFLILLAGHKRYTLPHADAMYHSGSGGMAGDYEKVRAAMESYDRTVKRMQEYALTRTLIPREDFERNKASDWYFTPEQMIKYGIVDGVVDDIGMVL